MAAEDERLPERRQSEKPGSEMSRWSKAWPKLTVGALLPVSFLGVFSASMFTSALYTTLTSLICLAAFCAAGFTFAHLRYFKPIREQRKSHGTEPLTDAIIEQLQEGVNERAPMKAEHAMIIALAIARPAMIRKRVVETYDPASLTRSIAITGCIPAELRCPSEGGEGHEPMDVPIPILMVRKGSLRDNFSVEVADGHVSALSYRESMELNASVLRKLLLMAAGRDALADEEREVERWALKQITRRDPVDTAAQDPKWLDRVKNLDLPHEAPRAMVMEMIKALLNHHSIVAWIPCDKNGRYAVCHRETHSPSVLSDSYEQLSKSSQTAWLREFLGTRPLEMAISLTLAYTAESYHFQLQGEEGLYLGQQNELGVKNYLSKHGPGTKGIPPHHSFGPMRGQPYGHYYTRFFPAPTKGEKAPSVEFKFHERPPGSIFRAAIAAVACFALVLLVAAVSIHLSPEADAPALLLVFPAVAAAWLGFDLPQRKLLEDAIEARLSLMLTVLVSLLASGQYMVYQTYHKFLESISDSNDPSAALDNSIWGGDNPAHFLTMEHQKLWIPGFPDMAWSFLILLAFFNFAYMSYICVVRFMAYRRICR